MSGPHSDEPVSLSERLLTYYRDTVSIHADDPVLHACLICRQHRCLDWRFAWERLVCAGELPVEAQWPIDLAGNGQCRPAGSTSTNACL